MPSVEPTRRDVLATTCPVCLADTITGACSPAGLFHQARVDVARVVADRVAEMVDDLNRRTVHRTRRARADAALAEPWALEDAVTNWQILQEPPSRLRTAPFPHVTSTRGVY